MILINKLIIKLTDIIASENDIVSSPPNFVFDLFIDKWHFILLHLLAWPPFVDSWHYIYFYSLIHDIAFISIHWFMTLHYSPFIDIHDITVFSTCKNSWHCIYFYSLLSMTIHVTPFHIYDIASVFIWWLKTLHLSSLIDACI